MSYTLTHAADILIYLPNVLKCVQIDWKNVNFVPKIGELFEVSLSSYLSTLCTLCYTVNMIN